MCARGSAGCLAPGSSLFPPWGHSKASSPLNPTLTNTVLSITAPDAAPALSVNLFNVSAIDLLALLSAPRLIPRERSASKQLLGMCTKLLPCRQTPPRGLAVTLPFPSTCCQPQLGHSIPHHHPGLGSLQTLPVLRRCQEDAAWRAMTGP